MNLIYQYVRYDLTEALQEINKKRKEINWRKFDLQNHRCIRFENEINFWKVDLKRLGYDLMQP